MGIKIILTGKDAHRYMEMKGTEIAVNRAFNASDMLLSSGISTADIQKANDEFNASKGIVEGEILTSPEDAQRILSELNLGAGATISIGSSEIVIPENVEILGLDGPLSTAKLFGASHVSEPIDGQIVVGSSAGYRSEYTESTKTEWSNNPGSVLVPHTPANVTIPVTPVVVPTVMQPSPGLPPAIVAIPPTLDKDGFPWDQRIHSGSKAINKDGTWRTKKNLDPATMAVVTAELKQLMAIPAGQQTIPLPPVLASLTAAQAGEIPRPPRTEIPPVPVIPFAPAVPVPPAAGAALTLISDQANSGAVPLPPITATGVSLSNIPVPPPPAVSIPSNIPDGYTPDPTRANMFLAPVLKFGELLFKVTQAIGAGTLTQAKVNEVCVKHGLPAGQIVLLTSRPDLIPQIARDLELA